MCCARGCYGSCTPASRSRRRRQQHRRLLRQRTPLPGSGAGPHQPLAPCRLRQQLWQRQRHRQQQRRRQRQQSRRTFGGCRSRRRRPICQQWRRPWQRRRLPARPAPASMLSRAQHTWSLTRRLQWQRRRLRWQRRRRSPGRSSCSGRPRAAARCWTPCGPRGRWQISWRSRARR